MRFIQNVQGSKESSQSPIFNYDTVYIHTNVKKLPDTEYQTNMYQYDEHQYTRNEYLTLMAERQQTESELTTELDLELSACKTKQQTESDLLTMLDFDLSDLIKEVETLKENNKKLEKRIEELEKNEVK